MLQIEKPEWIRESTKEDAIFRVVDAFLLDSSSSASTVEDLVDSATSSIIQHGDAAPSLAAYRVESRSLFAIILGITKQLKATSTQQAHLVQLMLAFREVPLPASVKAELDDKDNITHSMNSNLSNLINVLANFEHDAPLHPPLDDRLDQKKSRQERQPWRLDPGERLSGEEWANINGFIARIHSAAPTVKYLDVRGLFAMIEAFEVPSTIRELDDVVAAAAYWIIYAGDALRDNTIPYPHYPDDGETRRFPWSRGELWQGQRGFSAERWSFWLSRLEEMAARDDLSELSRTAARQAIAAVSRS